MWRELDIWTKGLNSLKVEMKKSQYTTINAIHITEFKMLMKFKLKQSTLDACEDQINYNN